MSRLDSLCIEAKATGRVVWVRADGSIVIISEEALAELDAHRRQVAVEHMVRIAKMRAAREAKS